MTETTGVNSAHPHRGLVSCTARASPTRCRRRDTLSAEFIMRWLNSYAKQGGYRGRALIDRRDFVPSRPLWTGKSFASAVVPVARV